MLSPNHKHIGNAIDNLTSDGDPISTQIQRDITAIELNQKEIANTFLFIVLFLGL